MKAQPRHPLETWARQVFGAYFVSVLLHGLYDEREAAEGRVQVGAGPPGAGSPKELVITPLGPGPWGRKPLVLAALFRLLIGRPEIGRDLRFTFKELLEELRWPDLPASRREVEDAVHFYYRCSYSPAGPTAGGRRVLGGGPRLLIGYELQGHPGPQCDLSVDEGDEGNKVWFNPELAEDLRQGRIVFAGVNFGRLASGHAGPPSESGPVPSAAAAPRAVTAPPRPTLRIKVTPVSKREADPRPKVFARAVGEIAVSIDTGAVASAVLRALNQTAARHPLPHGAALESWDAIAEYVHREIDRLLPRAFRAAVSQVKRRVCKEVHYLGHGVMHFEVPERAHGARGPQPVWHSPGHLFNSLMRAVEAVEFDGWRPGGPGVFVNKRWDLNNVSTATIVMIAAYWSEVEGMDLGWVDSGRMAKWLKSAGLPNFSRVREAARLRIIERRGAEEALEAYGKNPALFMLLWWRCGETE